MALADQFKHSLTKLRKEKEWTQAEVAEKLGLSLSGYQRIEQTGKTTAAMFEKLAKLFDVEVAVLVTGMPFANKNPLPKEHQAAYRIPVVNSIPASGFVRSFEDMISEDYTYTTIKRKGIFALKVSGDSMAPRIEHGDLVVLDPHAQFVDNAIYAVINGLSEATLKTVKKTEGGYYCIPMNTNYQTIFVAENELIRFYKVIQIVKNL